MHNAAATDDIPDPVLDRAFGWAVRLGSGTSDAADQAAFEAWLARSALHRAAWQRVQAVEQEFASARAATERGADALRRVGRTRQRVRRAAIASSLFSVVLLVGLVLFLGSFRAPAPADHVTAADERRQLSLPGGARIHLNSDTALSVARTPDGLTVTLRRGEILVDSGAVAPSDKPRITTSHGSFTPVGTRFVVHRQDDATALAVIHGRVLLHPANTTQQRQAGAGERWRVASGEAQPTAADGLVPGAWVDGVLEADNARLGDVLDALARHRSGRIDYDATAAALRVTGIFRLDDTDAALRALEQSLPVRMQRTPDWWVRVHAE